MLYNKADVARWCKGSTDDSDSSCEGSNPSLAANKKRCPTGCLFLL